MFILLIIFLSSYFGSRKKKEGFTVARQGTTTIYMDKIATRDFILKDEDKFVASMSAIDLSSRTPMLDKEDYKKDSSTTAVSYHPSETSRICDICLEIDQALKAKYPNMYMPTWVFALTDGNTYEMAQPHVRGVYRNIYFLSTETLAEERCQFRWTLLFLRMQTLFPTSNPVSTITNPSNPLFVSQTSVPEKLGLPQC